MRGLLALAAAAGALAIVAVVFALGASRDPVPGAIRDCVRTGGATLVKGPEGLQPVRADLLARDLPEAGRFPLGEDSEALLLAGTRARVLVVAGPSSPELGGPEFRERLYADPSRFAVVAVEIDPRRGLLARCARESR